MPRYAPTVQINGVTLAGSWDGSSRAALDSATLVWGRSDLLGQPDPTKATLDLIDPDGLWGTDPAVYGQSLTITTSLGIMFRGNIDTITMAPVVVFNPVAHREQRVWRVTLDAIDPTAEAGKLIPLGKGVPSTETANNKAFAVVRNGANEWPEEWYAQRLADLGALGTTAGLISGLENAAPYSDHLMRMRTMADGMSLLDLIRECYRVNGVQHVNYNPTTRGIERGTLAPATGLLLYLDGATMRVRPLTGHAIPAQLIEHTTDGEISSTLSENVATVRLLHGSYGTNTSATINGVDMNALEDKDDTTTVAVPNTPANGARNVLEVESGLKSLTRTITQDARPAALATAFAAIVGQLNGKIPAPPVRFDIERFNYGAAAEAVLMATRDLPVPLYLSGAIYNALANFGPMFQLIGGTLTYAQGWTLDAILAPTVTARETLLVAALVTLPNPTLADYDPIITLADLGHVTQGLS